MAESTDKNVSSSENDMFEKVYDDTSFFIDSVADNEIFKTVFQMMKEGNASVELRKRYMLRAIDETWVNIIEDTLPALDMIIRSPTKHITEKEEVLPIELSRNISVRSLQHLSQHTNFISKVEGDKITPNKILNVYREETYQTYENKFINTLINRLYIFVNSRYDIARKRGQDEKTTSLDFNDEFEHDDSKIKMQFHLEISDTSEREDEGPQHNYTFTSDLWRRVVRLNGVVSTYLNSEFVKNMEGAYIRPPVMRTNAILKNKNFRQCLALWQFIESYESAGYSMLIEENLEKVSEDMIKKMYSTMAVQYLLFKKNIKNEFDSGDTIETRMTEDEIKPKIIEEFKDYSEGEFDHTIDMIDPLTGEMIPPHYDLVTPNKELLIESLNVALDADSVIRENHLESEFGISVVEEPEPVVAPEEPEEETEEGEEVINPYLGMIEYLGTVTADMNDFEELSRDDMLKKLEAAVEKFKADFPEVVNEPVGSHAIEMEARERKRINRAKRRKRRNAKKKR